MTNHRRLSFSAISLYCQNKALWYSRYIAKETEEKSEAVLLGSLFHKAMEKFFSEKMSIWQFEELAKPESLNSILDSTDLANFEIKDIDALFKQLKQAIMFFKDYFVANIEKFPEILFTEQAFTSNFGLTGTPLMGVVDLGVKPKGSTVLYDFKLVGKHSNPSYPKIAYLFQAWLYEQLYLHNSTPPSSPSVVFLEVKKTKNRDTSLSQVQEIVINPSQLASLDRTFNDLIDLVTEELNGKALSLEEGEFIPNIFSWTESDNLKALQIFQKARNLEVYDPNKNTPMLDLSISNPFQNGNSARHSG